MTDAERETAAQLTQMMADSYQTGIALVGRMAGDMARRMQLGTFPLMDGPRALLTVSVMAERLVDELKNAPPPTPGDSP